MKCPNQVDVERGNKGINKIKCRGGEYIVSASF